MDVLQGARSSWAEKILEAREVLVPEWPDEDGNPLKIFVRPANLAEKDKMYAFAKKDNLDFLAKVIVLRARDASGLPMFNSKTHHPILMTAVDPEVVERVGLEINEDMKKLENELVEAAKN